MRKKPPSFKEHAWIHGDWTFQINTWPISRLHFSAGWADSQTGWVSLSWGTPGCDPVWLIEKSFAVSERVSKLVDRWYARRDFQV